jgi:hypothetical protein
MSYLILTCGDLDVLICEENFGKMRRLGVVKIDRIMNRFVTY